MKRKGDVRTQLWTRTDADRYMIRDLLNCRRTGRMKCLLLLPGGQHKSGALVMGIVLIAGVVLLVSQFVYQSLCR